MDSNALFENGEMKSWIEYIWQQQRIETLHIQFISITIDKIETRVSRGKALFALVNVNKIYVRL